MGLLFIQRSFSSVFGGLAEEATKYFCHIRCYIDCFLDLFHIMLVTKVGLSHFPHKAHEWKKEGLLDS